jgi:hypothetical protein
MLFSGELSMTTVELAVDEPDVPVDADEVAPPVDPFDPLDEQAARPAARRPAAVSATALLLLILLIVNFDLPSERLLM